MPASYALLAVINAGCAQLVVLVSDHDPENPTGNLPAPHIRGSQEIHGPRLIEIVMYSFKLIAQNII